MNSLDFQQQAAAFLAQGNTLLTDRAEVRKVSTDTGAAVKAVRWLSILPNAN